MFGADPASPSKGNGDYAPVLCIVAGRPKAGFRFQSGVNSERPLLNQGLKIHNRSRKAGFRPIPIPKI